MSNQSTYSNSIENAISAAVNNSRQKQMAAKATTDSLTKLTSSIKNIANKEIVPANDAIAKAEKDKNYVTVLQNAYKRTHSNTADPTLTAQLQIAQTKIDKQKVILSNANIKIDGINKKITDIGGTKVTKVGTVTVGTTTSGSGGITAPVGKKTAFSKDYQYNAPMIKSAYFGTESIQSDVLNKNHVDQGNYQDAIQAWKGVQGGRGTIQMDRKFIQLFDLSDPTAKFDLQKYGFKFLYNPTTVSMAWGLMSQMDPTFEASGLDKFQAVSAGLLSSTVEFELMLNRVSDFDYIGENGLKISGSNPYPLPVPINDLKSIYRKGTMYDIEYLLKTLNGPNGQFTSALNGVTSDRGWMRPTIVELHLGNAMRYRVRIANLSVNHIMFNNRMVPILSTVKLTCSRFNDGPESTTTVNSGGGANSPASGLTNLRNTTPGYGR